MKNIKIALKMCVSIMILQSCTYSINMIHSSGTATDMIDEAQTAQPDVSPTITVPVSPGFSLPSLTTSTTSK